MHHSLHQSCLGPSFSIRQQPCSLPQQLARCRAQHRPRCHVAAATAAQAYSSTSAAAAAAATTSSSSTALQLRRLQQPQHMYGDMSAQQQSPTTSPDQASGRDSKSQKAAGFGGPKNSKSSSSSNGSKQQQQQQQQWATVQLQDNCLCRSGLRYQDCCHPFLSGHSQPRSAAELARARITAGLTGDVPYLASSTHPDSSLALGGSRDLARRYKRTAAYFRDCKPVVVGMAHCRGDEEGTWLVLAILQETVGEFKGTKQPVMYLMAQKGSSSSSSRSSSSRTQEPAGSWLFMGDATKFPEHQDSEVLWQLVQQHCPEALRGADDDSSSSSSSGMVNREVYFAWSMPSLGLPTAPEAAAAAAAAAGSNGGSSGSDGGWYLDLLKPAAQRLGSSSSNSSSAGAQTGSGGWGFSGGVVSMDALREMRAGKHS